MKRFYFFLIFLFVSVGLFAQIGPSWWQMLPADWRTNPPARDTVSILKVSDDAIEQYASLAELFAGIPAEEIPIVNTSNGACNLLDANDFSANVKAFFDNSNYYVLYNVNDEDVQTEGLDRIEMHLAPYADSCDPGRPIYPAGYEPAGATDTVGDYNFWGRWISGEEYVLMSYRGSWTEVGAFKTEWVLASSEEYYPSACTYTLLGPNHDTLGDVVTGAPPVPFQCIYEPKTGGYYFLAIMPHSLFPMEPDPVTFPMMSVAFKVNDKDADDIDCTTDDEETDVDRYEAWGAATNDAYWAIAFNGGIGKFDFSTSVKPIKVTEASAYYYSGYLRLVRQDLVRSVSVYNITGALIRSVQSPSELINISDLTGGIYIVRINQFNGSSSVTKIVK
jgi:hypothetical protein